MWSPQQERALKEVEDWMSSGTEQVYRLFGFAGTGKTTLARHIAEQHGGRVLFAAFTGKAAHVLQQKGCSPSTTVHSLIYRTEFGYEYSGLEMQIRTLEGDRDKEEDTAKKTAIQARIAELKEQLLADATKRGKKKMMFVLNESSEVRNADLVILDEASMVNEEMGRDLLSFGTKVLVLGDPAQLPPVFGAGFFTNGTPDFMLTEVHRQARDNPIIHLATTIREGGVPKAGNYGQSCVLRLEDTPRDELTKIMLEADQILVGKNDTRRMFNDRMRALLGFSGAVPVVGEKVICLKNNHDLKLYNGSLWYVDSCTQADLDDVLTLNISTETRQPFLDPEGVPIAVPAYASLFIDEQVEFPEDDVNQFTYGYAITCHKSQGSQWNNVAVWDQSWVFRADKFKWLYTAVTRAAEKLTLVRT